MASIAPISWQDVLRLRDEVRALIRDSTTIEAAAQCTTQLLFEKFRDSLVLVRCFATAPFSALPQTNQTFVRQLVFQTGDAIVLEEGTLVLSLLGTSGLETAWNNRHESRGHIGIPLISSSFIQAIPMVARLLVELNVDLDWFDGEREGLTQKQSDAGTAGLFYVRDAATTVDRLGRYVIPAQDFVANYGVKTVFGIGGTYADGTILSLVLFTRDVLERSDVEPYSSLIVTLKAATAELAQAGKFFDKTHLPAS